MKLNISNFVLFLLFVIKLLKCQYNILFRDRTFFVAVSNLLIDFDDAVNLSNEPETGEKSDRT